MVLENQTNGSLFADDDIMIKAKNDIIFIGNIIYSNKDTNIEANNICSIERAKIVTVSEKIVKNNIDESTVSIDRILQTQEIAGAPIIIMNGSDTRIMAQNGYRSFGSQISGCNLYIKTIDGDIIKSGLALKNIVTTSTKTFTRIN